jgi:hypothetical protein
MPTPTSYVYTISTDLPSGLVSVARLRQEIELSAIVTMIDFVAGGIAAPGNDTVTIWFKDPLTTPDKTIFDGSAGAPAAHPTVAGSLLYTHSGLALPDDPQNVNVTGGSVTVDGGTIDANGKILSPDDVTYLGDATNPLRVSPVGNTAITAVSLPLPGGAATEATLAALNTNAGDIETILTNIRDTAGIKKITDALPAGTNNIGDVDVVSSALPAGAATETTLAALNTNAADIEAVLIAIRDTAGVKKITDQLPAGTNNIGDVDVVSSALPAGAATEATVATLATQATAALIRAKTDNLDVLLSTRATEATVATLATQTTVAAINTATGTTADADTANTVIGRLKQLVTKLAGGLPAALVGGRLDSNIGAWLGATTPTVGSKVSADSIPTVIASDQVAVASKNAVSTQVDGHSLTLGSTADADTANTVIGRLKQTITKLAGGLPAALTGAGNLKTSIMESFPAGTNRLGSVRIVDANDLALDLARNTTIPANSRGLLVVGDDEDGKAQALEVSIDPLDGKRRLQIEGHVSIAAPEPPVGTTVVSFTFSGALSISATQTDNYVITNGKRFVLQQIVAGSEGDTSEKGSVIEVFYFDGTTEYLVEREYINGFTTQLSPLTETSRDGAQTMDGNGTTKTVRVKRRRLSGSSQEVDFVIRGYEYTP